MCSSARLAFTGLKVLSMGFTQLHIALRIYTAAMRHKLNLR